MVTTRGQQKKMEKQTGVLKSVSAYADGHGPYGAVVDVWVEDDGRVMFQGQDNDGSVTHVEVSKKDAIDLATGILNLLMQEP